MNMITNHRALHKTTGLNRDYKVIITRDFIRNYSYSVLKYNNYIIIFLVSLTRVCVEYVRS